MAEREQFAADITPHLDELKRICANLSRHREDGEDLYQDTLIRGYERYHQFQAGTNLGAWLATIAKHLHIDRQRRHKPTEPLTVDPAVIDEADLEIEHSEMMLRVTAAVAALPPRLREVLEMVDVRGLSSDEAAEVLAVPVGTVLSRCHRARIQLRALLAEDTEGYGLAA